MVILKRDKDKEPASTPLSREHLNWNCRYKGPGGGATPGHEASVAGK